MKTIYPKNLSEGSTIGVTAPSSGVLPKFEKRLEIACAHKVSLGYNVRLGKCLFGNNKEVSAPAKERAADLMAMFEDPEIDAIIPPWGGELLIEIYPYLDFDLIAKNPKWICGYSDTSSLLFATTLKTGIATVHGMNLIDGVSTQKDSLSMLWDAPMRKDSGEEFVQSSSELYQSKWSDFTVDPESSFQLDTPTKWKELSGLKNCNFDGRLIGGCLDVLVNLTGTEYGNLQSYGKNVGEGLVVYLENCELSPYDSARALWNMRLAGWFENAKGILIGRTPAKDASSSDQLSQIEALESALSELNIPVLYDVDIGHVPPQLTLVNGSLCSVQFEEGKGTITQRLI